MSQDIQVRSNEAQREQRRKEKLDRELKQSKNELEQKTNEVKSMGSQCQRYKDDIDKLENQLKEQKVSIFYSFLSAYFVNSYCLLLHAVSDMSSLCSEVIP